MKQTLLILFFIGQSLRGTAQVIKLTNGIVFEAGSSTRLANVKVLNKKNALSVMTNEIGEFKIEAMSGDTLHFSNNSYSSQDVVVDKTQTVLTFLNKVIVLDEIRINESTIKKDLLETQRLYRSKGVFYTGKPHYYYLFLKPMTFIYENFKSEVINARKFKKFAEKELEASEIRKRFNKEIIKRVVPINDEEAENFVNQYMPTIQKIRIWTDYDIAIYIKTCYQEYLKKSRQEGNNTNN